jgi:hypothetical protein
MDDRKHLTSREMEKLIVGDRTLRTEIATGILIG